MARSGNVDFKQLEALAERINQMNDFGKDEFCRDCVNELGQRLYRRVRMRTPHGHPPKLEKSEMSVKIKGTNGRTRSFLTRKGALHVKYWSGYKGGTLKKGWDVTPTTKQGNEYMCEVINPVEYASYVEYGHRQTPGRYVPALDARLKEAWVEGQFMLTKSEKEIQAFAPKRIEKKLNEKLEEMLNGK